MKVSGIYLISVADGKYYIGSAINIEGRWLSHKSELRRGVHKNAKLQNAWNKYGELNFQFVILLICEPDNLLLYEQIFLDFIKPYYNINPRAESSLGVKRSIETRIKCRTSHFGKKDSEETRQRKIAKLTGRAVSEVTRGKLAAQFGWKHSEEAKQKMRGRVRTAEHTRKIADALLGKRGPWAGKSRPQETRDKISAALEGRCRSIQSRTKQSATWAQKRETLNSVTSRIKE